MSSDFMVGSARPSGARAATAVVPAAARAVERSPALMAAPISAPASRPIPAPVSRPVSAPAFRPSPAPEIPSPASGVGDLRAQLRAQLEADLDYQILRRNFALDRDEQDGAASGASGASAASAAPATASPAMTGDSAAVSSERIGELSLSLSVRQGSAVSLGAAGQPGWETATLNVESLSLQRLSIRFGATPGEPEVRQADPLVLDLSGQGLTTTGVDAGVRFDLTGDGRAEQVSFVTGDSWLLALDRDTNGWIDDGRELFGDQHGAANGFEELAKFDANRDGRIDAEDPIFGQLRLFQMTSAGEQRLKSLTESNVVAIELGYQHVRKALDAYDTVAQTGSFRRADGSAGEAADVLLGYRSLA